MLELICKELGVEFGEEWKNNVGDTYKITEEGLFYMFSDGDWEEVSNKGYKMLLKGELKPVWEPKWGDEYYIPLPNDISSYGKRRYTNETVTNIHFQRGLIFKTKGEAIECAYKMIEAIK